MSLRITHNVEAMNSYNSLSKTSAAISKSMQRLSSGYRINSAADDAAVTDEDTAATIDVVANDSDIDGDAVAITEVTQPAHGVAEVIDGTHVVYTPAADYNGGDTLTITANDNDNRNVSGALTAAELVSIFVRDAPSITAETDPAAVTEAANAQSQNIPAITGTLTLSTTCGTSARVPACETIAWSSSAARNVPRCPPAS